MVAAEVAAGPGIVQVPTGVDDEETRWYAFSERFVRYLTGTATPEPGRLIVVRVRKDHLGESMVGTIAPGSLCLVDRGPGARGPTQIEDGKVYLLRDLDDDGGAFVKRVYQRGAHLVLASDNEDAGPRLVNLRGRRIQDVVVGRVRWVGTTLE
jgi:phage repressor protein C with HTH and peptisase S24 domain